MDDSRKSVKDRIVSAAWDLFYEKGYDDTTVDDIIRLSNTSKGSFYYYFDGKDALLNTLSTVLDEHYKTLREELSPEMDHFEQLMFLNYKAHSFMENSIKVDLLASLYSTQLISKGDRSLLDQNREYYKLVASIIEEGQKAGEINDSKSVSELVKYYSLCERALVTDWCLNRGSYSLAEYSKEYMPVMMNRFKEKRDS
ncbi:TetR/AcrR family transcriptional regulator [Sellimonas caecigallum]|uniref:TetR/AcrR family transcriptional regulator n=1 Tax=Sellimonas caecigallum TaxID=2592333 RepID=A0ABS7L564_9FIRM|nr:TetR/AcrR family transcriptional regulator [Sellimonas caecigallum]MBY0758183.1 TetR/AcrR family transcriptional regulator [Sellimonas caecigallum]OUP01298.1 TetR family transcriptional regulator [Drancourtella sp. An210]